MVTTPEWKQAHEQLSRFARERAAREHEEGCWLLIARRAGAHAQLGYGSFIEYVERLFGWGPRFIGERIRVAEALEHLPEIGQALKDGLLTWSAVRELTRVAIAETEVAWLAASCELAVRDIENLVSGYRPGDLPTDRPRDDARRHTLRLEVSGASFALYREAYSRLAKDAGHHLDDDEVVQLMARHVLEGPRDSGRASYQIAVTVCDCCARSWQQGRGEMIALDAADAAMAECDAQRAGLGRATQDVTPATRRGVKQRDHERCVVPGCRNSVFLDVHHLKGREGVGAHEAENLVVVCGAHHKAFHDGRLLIDGSPSTGLTFRHANGARYGMPGVPVQGVTHVGNDEGEKQLLREALRVAVVS